MQTYVVALELHGLNGHYDAFVTRLVEMGARCEQGAVWTLRSHDLTGAAIKRDLSRYIHPSDRLFVAKLAA